MLLGRTDRQNEETAAAVPEGRDFRPGERFKF